MGEGGRWREERTSLRLPWGWKGIQRERISFEETGTKNGESTKGGLREGTGGRKDEAHLVELEGSTFQSSSSDTPRETETTQAVVYLAPLDQYILERGGSWWWLGRSSAFEGRVDQRLKERKQGSRESETWWPGEARNEEVTQTISKLPILILVYTALVSGDERLSQCSRGRRQRSFVTSRSSASLFVSTSSSLLLHEFEAGHVEEISV